MGAVLIHVADVVERIKAIDAFRFVGVAADLATVKNLRQNVPAAYVMPATSQSIGDNNINAADELIEDSFQIYIVARNVKDARGAAALESLEPLRLKVYSAMVGWLPPNGHTEFRFRRGMRESYDDQCIYWLDEFSASRLCQQ